jgi:hypothetical protein
MKRLKIYVAGPYTPANCSLHDAAKIAHENTKLAINVGVEIIKKGHIPFIPHLTHFMHLESEKPLPKEFYYAYDIEWLKNCDALYYIGRSPGADRELIWAEQNGLKIYRYIIEIPIGEPW